MGKGIDFTGLAAALLSRWQEFVPAWAPGGRMQGKEFVAGSVRGGPGNSFKFNTENGKWADFATEEKGGDMVSLYASVQGIGQGDAAKRLADLINYRVSDTGFDAIRSKPTSPTLVISPPPSDAPPPSLAHPHHGAPVANWCYRLPNGAVAFYEARYDTDEGKEILPWSWDAGRAKWVAKSFPAPRPLYGLPELAADTAAPVLIVEGPKCAEAARKLVGSRYVVVTWNGGAGAVMRSDWTPLKGRKLLIWPDADDPGVEAAQKIADLLKPTNADIKIIDVYDMPAKWDVADAVAEDWDWARFREWAKPRAMAIERPPEPVMVESAPLPAPVVNLTQNNLTVNTEEAAEDVPSAVALWDRLGMALTKQGNPICNMENVLRYFEREPTMEKFCWFDTFHQKIYTEHNGPFREWSDRDTLELTKFMQRDIALSKVSQDMVFSAITLYAHGHPRNEPRDWMETLKWDGENRLSVFFADCLGAVDTPYTRAVSNNFWIGMVARIFRPGCKMDNMVVLEGEQGTMKSTALHKIGGRWFSETNESVTNKDFFLILQGKLIVEIAELHTFSKAEVTRIKQVITCQTDRYRAPYERLVADHPRQSIFVGTTNEETYLRDTTGNRRFWPVRCGKINIPLIEEWRNQLFAEAVAKFKEGAKWWEMPADETLAAQEERRQADAWEAMISVYCDSLHRVTVPEVATQGLKFEPSRLDKVSQQRIVACLKKIGWKTGNRAAQEWVRPDLLNTVENTPDFPPLVEPPFEEVPAYAED